jgi:hypothetical protein
MSAFWFHYNKPASRAAGHPVMTVHHRDACILVRKIVCSVPVCSRERRTQPHVVIAGRGLVRIAGDTAYITGDKA